MLCRAVVLALLLAASPSFAAEPPATADIAREMQEKYGSARPFAWGEFLPGVVTRLDGRAFALTLDACGGKTDTRIIALLREYAVPATIFATNIWLRRNAALAGELAADPLFTFACHGKRHRPASVSGRKVYGIAGTASVPDLVEEVEDNAREIQKLTGKRPLWYRSGAAYYDDVALRVIRDLGLHVAGYAVSLDAGASLPAGEVARRLLAAPEGSIVLCHLNHPESGTYAGLARSLPAMLKRGARFVSLEEDFRDGNRTKVSDN